MMPEEPELYRPKETLPLFPELLRVAEISSESVSQAAETWEDTPLGEVYPDILQAETEDYQGEA